MAIDVHKIVKVRILGPNPKEERDFPFFEEMTVRNALQLADAGELAASTVTVNGEKAETGRVLKEGDYVLASPNVSGG